MIEFIGGPLDGRREAQRGPRILSFYWHTYRYSELKQAYLYGPLLVCYLRNELRRKYETNLFTGGDNP